MARRGVFGLAAVGAAGALALAACGGSSTTTPTSSGFDKAVTSVVNPSTAKGGTLVFDNSSAPDSSDAGNTYYAFNLNFTRLYATPLTTYKSCPGKCGAQVVPALAASLGTASNGNKTWTFHLKPGVKYEDGTPVTSQDVKYAVERTFDRTVLPNGPSYFASLLAGNAAHYPGPFKNRSKNLMGLTAITTPSPTTIVFNLNQPFADFNYVVAFPQTAPVPPSKDTGANYQKHPMSTGPYKFASFQLNKQYTLVPNPQWNPSWDPQVKQLASKVVVNLNVNANDIDSRLLAGDISVDQAGSGVQAAGRAKILSNPTLKASSDDPVNGFMWFYYINSKVPPLNNVHCRMAVEFAANKTNLQTAYGGPYGGSIASTSMPPTVLGFQKFDLYHALTKPGGDIPAAKEQLKLCGHPSGFSTNIAYRSDRPREVASSQALQASLNSVGIKTTLKGYTAANYYSNFAGVPNYVHSHDLGLLAGGWGPDWPSGYGWGWALWDGKSIVPAGNTNIGELNDPQINKWFLQMEEATSQTERNTITHQIDMQVMKDAVVLPAVYAKALLYRGPNLTNVNVQNYYGMYNYGILGAKK
ncbi:MAG TPA: ABC transporter substrate-binding protein [Streptosporangiaceae bacterium]|nr:ABC transporter substrate-binding protein [Streptosporangiaceae bacterium]